MHNLSLKLTQHSKNTTFAKQNNNTEKISMCICEFANINKEVKHK
jgi:hypothetical protein